MKTINKNSIASNYYVLSNALYDTTDNKVIIQNLNKENYSLCIYPNFYVSAKKRCYRTD